LQSISKSYVEGDFPNKMQVPKLHLSLDVNAHLVTTFEAKWCSTWRQFWGHFLW